MRLVLKMPESLTTSCWIKIDFRTGWVCWVCLVFDDYDRAVEYAGDENLVTQVSVIE